MSDKCLILLSGGFDSIALLYNRQRDIKEALFIYYGAKNNNEEFYFASLHCQRLEIPLHTIDVCELFENLFTNSKLIGGSGSVVVPFRNGIFLSIAVAYADIKKYDVVLYGSLGAISEQGTHPVFPDCSFDFMDAMNRTALEGTENSVRVSAPYIGFTKKELRTLTEFNGNLLNAVESYSCYEGRPEHCGKCFACKERKKALKGVDKTEYEK